MNKSSAAAVFSETRPVLANAPPSLQSAVIKGSLEGSPVEILVDSRASENFIDAKVARRLNLLLDRVRINRYGFVRSFSAYDRQSYGCIRTLGMLVQWFYVQGAARTLRYVIVGQEFLKRHSSVTFVMNGPEDPLTIGTPSTTTSAQLPIAAAKLDPLDYLLSCCWSANPLPPSHVVTVATIPRLSNRK